MDEEQLFLRRNGSGGSISSAVDLSSLDVLNGDISNSADARRKRFLVAEALQVSSKNPTMVVLHNFTEKDYAVYVVYFCRLKFFLGALRCTKISPICTT